MDILSESLENFISQTAARTSTPGGGSVAGVVGALSAALAQMSLNFSAGRKNLAEFSDYHNHLASRLEKAREMFLRLAQDDIAAFGQYQQANNMQAGPQKDDALELASACVINVPIEMIKLSLALLEDFEVFAQRCNKWLITDLMAAAALAVAVVKLSYYNVRINLSSLKDRQAVSELRDCIDGDMVKALELLEDVEQKGFKLLG